MSRSVFCGNFEYETRQSDLERLFSKYGRVERVDMKSAMTESSNTQRTRAQEEYSRRNDSECKEERDQRNKRRRDRYKEKKMNAEKDRLYLCTGDQGPIQQSMPSLNVESCGQLANTHQAKTPSIDPDCSPLTEIESLEEARLKSLIKGLKVEYGILDKLVYKNKNQHRRSSYFQYLVKVTRDLRVLLQSADLEHIFNSSFLVIHGKRPKHKVQLLESLKRRKCHGNYSFLDRLLGIARLLSQIIEPIVKAAMEISALIARSFFMGFSLAIMALLARLRVLVQQMLLDVVSVYNTVSSLSRKEQSVKLTQDGLEVYRDLYPAREQAVYLDCVWKTDKFVLFENVSEHVDTNQDAIPIDVYPGEASTVQYQCIETLLGDTDEPVTVDQSFTHEQGSSDIKGNNQCFLEGSTDRTNDGKLVTDGREGQCFAGVTAICSEKRPTEGAFLKNKSESRNKVAFVSVKMPITSAQDAVIPVKDSESCGNTEDPALRLIADGNLKEILL